MESRISAEQHGDDAGLSIALRTAVESSAP